MAHVRARVEPAEAAFAARILPEPAVELFEAMPVADRRHGLDVAEKLIATGHDDQELLAAALLHDAGKGARMRVWHRVSGVLLESLAPGFLRRLADPNPRSWRHPFHLYLHHEAISARMAEAAGCSPRVAAFIRGDSGVDALLSAALRTADDAS